MNKDELKALQKGDSIKNFQYGGTLYKAKVLQNFPDNCKIQLKFGIALFGLITMKTIIDYNYLSNNNFDLAEPLV